LLAELLEEAVLLVFEDLFELLELILERSIGFGLGFLTFVQLIHQPVDVSGRIVELGLQLIRTSSNCVETIGN